MSQRDREAHEAEKPGGEALATKQPMPGPGCFQWNRGGWFGSQLGSTAWMLLGAVRLMMQAPGVAVVWLVCFTLANSIGFWLWWRRDRLRPYPALQSLLLACGVNGLIALVSLHVLGVTRPRGTGLGVESLSIPIPLIMGMFIIMMAWFHLMEWSAKRERSRSQGQPSA